MNKRLLAPLFLLLILTSAAYAGETKTIALKDGSTIQGQVTRLEKGTYTIESPLLGKVEISEEKILGITTASSEKAATEQAQGVNIDTAQAQILANPDAMKDIQAIAADPEVVALISDPAFMQIVQSKDPAAIQANPKTQQLMENPKIKALIQKLQSQGQH